jgi:hypothetical protein
MHTTRVVILILIILSIVSMGVFIYAQMNQGGDTSNRQAAPEPYLDSFECNDEVRGGLCRFNIEVDGIERICISPMHTDGMTIEYSTKENLLGICYPNDEIKESAEKTPTYTTIPVKYHSTTNPCVWREVKEEFLSETYINSEYGFSVRHPDNFSIEETSNGTFRAKRNPGVEKGQLNIIRVTKNNQNKSIEDLLDEKVDYSWKVNLCLFGIGEGEGFVYEDAGGEPKMYFVVVTEKYIFNYFLHNPLHMPIMFDESIVGEVDSLDPQLKETLLRDGKEVLSKYVE